MNSCHIFYLFGSLFFMLLLWTPARFSIMKEKVADISDFDRNLYQWDLIQRIYKDYPNFVIKLLEYHEYQQGKIRAKNETYQGYLLEMTRDYGYELLLANAYTQKYEDHVFESGKASHTVLYKCEKAIRYCSGNPQYCEFHEGSFNTNIILVSGHDGMEKPKSIPNRDAGCWINKTCVYNHNCVNRNKGIEKNYEHCAIKDRNDVYSRNMTTMLAREIYNMTGIRPHVIINNLYREKLDVNRKLDLASFGVPEAMNAWYDFHNFIDQAKAMLKGTQGIVLDIHGNSISEHWNMFGYMAHPSSLDNEKVHPNETSIKSLAEHVEVPFDKLLRGTNSLAHFMQMLGFRSVPNIKHRYPRGRHYFRGGYTVGRHGSKFGGNIDAVIVEIYEEYRTLEKSYMFVSALAKSLLKYMDLNYKNKGLYTTTDLKTQSES